MTGLPELLTVEEAARLLRVGRTKAYAMTREWRATEGRSGLPVVDFGNVLRVPRAALEARVGVELSGMLVAQVPAAVEAATGAAATETPSAASPPTRRRRPSRRRANADPGQLSLLPTAQCSDTTDIRRTSDVTESSRPVKA